MVESRRSALNEVAKAKLLSTYLGTTEIGPGMLFGVIVDNPQHGPLALQLPPNPTERGYAHHDVAAGSGLSGLCCLRTAGSRRLKKPHCCPSPATTRVLNPPHSPHSCVYLLSAL